MSKTTIASVTDCKITELEGQSDMYANYVVWPLLLRTLLTLGWQALQQRLVHVCSGEEAVRSAFINVDQAGVGSLTQQQFEAALKQAGVDLTRHQMISLHRRLAKDGHVQVADVLQILT